MLLSSPLLSGIGLALCERLLTEDGQLRLCLACRNTQRGEAARSALLTSHSNAHVDLLHLDVGSVQSVLAAAQEVKARYCYRDVVMVMVTPVLLPELSS